MKHSNPIKTPVFLTFGIIMALLLACNNTPKKSIVVENDSITQVIVKMNGLVSACPKPSTFFREDFDKAHRKDSWLFAELIYKTPEEIEFICDILNSATPCKQPFEGEFYSPQTIAAGENYKIIDGGIKVFSDPVNTVFKIEIYSAGKCQIIWGGMDFFDTDSTRYETPDALLRDFRRAKQSEEDWMLYDKNNKEYQQPDTYIEP